MSRTLLVVCPEGPALRVFTCVARFSSWSLGRVEAFDFPLGELQPEAIAAAVRPLTLRWSVPPGTEVVLVLPAIAGGVVSLDRQTGSKAADRARREMALAARVPFSPGDLEYEVSSGQGGANDKEQVVWLPRSVAVEFRNAFARLGLVLGEIVFRAQLFAAGDPEASAGGPKLVIEQWAAACFLHLVGGGRVLKTSVAEARSAREIADRVQLELLSAETYGQALSRVTLAAPKGALNDEIASALKNGVHGLGIARQEADIPAMFLRFWRSGATGIWLVPEDPAPLAMVRRLAYAIGGCGVVLAAGIAWHESAVREEISMLESREIRLRPQYQAWVAKERQSLELTATAAAVARVSSPPADVQAALYAVFTALPRAAWVTRFTFENGNATVVGRGIDSESVMTSLKTQAGIRRVVDASREGATDPAAAGAGQRFRVQFQWGSDAPAPESERAKNGGPK